MAPTVVTTPTSRLRLGLSQCDITPPADTYHRLWGAAKHDRAEGIHRPLLATVLAIEPLESSGSPGRSLIIALDLCLFRPPEMDEILNATAALLSVPADTITFTFSHTHSSGNYNRDRASFRGGERIGPYLDALPARLAAAAEEAIRSLSPVVVNYAFTTSAMGHNRDYPDPAHGIYACGFNPEEPAVMPLGAVRICTESGQPVATLVNYPCHPTTLAWDNRLISPDYVGMLRETVEADGGGPCLFLLAPCGDIGPRVGYVGDTAVADRNGRQVGLAAASALLSLPPSGADFHYAGPVFSGATLGTWEDRPQSEERRAETAIFRHKRMTIPLPYLAGLPTVAQAEQELAAATAQEEALQGTGDEAAHRDARALAERKRRLIERVRPLPSGETYLFVVELWQLGDAFWIIVEGEPYHALQAELQRRFPGTPFVLAVLGNGARPSYLPERHDYGRPLYQAEIALLAPGCLERLIDELSSAIRSMKS